MPLFMEDVASEFLKEVENIIEEIKDGDLGGGCPYDNSYEHGRMSMAREIGTRFLIKYKPRFKVTEEYVNKYFSSCDDCGRIKSKNKMLYIEPYYCRDEICGPGEDGFWSCQDCPTFYDGEDLHAKLCAKCSRRRITNELLKTIGIL